VNTLAAAAAKVLRANDLGAMTAAAPSLYPHQWSWDAAFITIGLARIDVPRAVTELRTLLGAQWSTGMLPHIRFAPGGDYFPGADRWDSSVAAAAPRDVRTSGICQPPVHALAVRAILDANRAVGEAFAAETFDAWLAWHRWLATARDADGDGLVEIHHGWESGMDNSPRWDPVYAGVVPGADLPAFERRDTLHVAGATERPTDTEYARYLWLVEQLKRVRYDDAAAAEVVDFRAADVFLSACLALASDVLGGIGDELGRTADAAELRALAARCRDGVAATVDPVTGLARDRDLRAGAWIGTETVAGFAPLVAGGPRDLLDAQVGLLLGDRWCGYPGLRVPVPPSTSPASDAFRARTYWRGPQWPFLTWLFGYALRRHGYDDAAGQLREGCLEQLSAGRFGEYYDPFTGTAVGSPDQSWTAAVTLDWLAL
jgi:glucosylglycerate hydrolase